MVHLSGNSKAEPTIVIRHGAPGVPKKTIHSNEKELRYASSVSNLSQDGEENKGPALVSFCSDLLRVLL